jgi:hypothetical protein
MQATRVTLAIRQPHTLAIDGVGDVDEVSRAREGGLA